MAMSMGTAFIDVNPPLSIDFCIENALGISYLGIERYVAVCSSELLDGIDKF